jgi:hypothetical protein
MALALALAAGCQKPEEQLPTVVTTVTTDGPNPKTISIQFKRLGENGKITLNDRKVMLHYKSELLNAVKAIEEVEKSYE